MQLTKKIKVVNAVAERSGLSNVAAYHQRAETVEGQFDFVVSRAVTRTKNFLPWVNDKIKKGYDSIYRFGFNKNMNLYLNEVKKYL